jgi:hypothetical protein
VIRITPAPAFFAAHRPANVRFPIGSSRRFVAATLLVAAVSCGGRTPLYFFFPDEPEPDAGIPRVDSGVPVFDAGGPDAVATADASLRPDVATPVDAASEPDVFIAPGAVSCTDPAGLQPGSPWPIARRCPGRAGNTAALGPTSAPHVAWQAQATGSWADEVVIAADGTVYAYDLARGVVAFDMDGSTKWVVDVPLPDGGMSSSSPPVSLAIGADGTLYVWTGELSAIRPDGSIAWTVPVSALRKQTVFFDIAVGADGTIYVVDTAWDADRNAPVSHLFGVDTTGRTLWTTTFDPAALIVAGPSIGSSGAVYLVTSGANGIQMEAFTPGGELAWTAGAGTNSNGTQVVVVVGPDGTVYVPCTRRRFELCEYTADGTALPTPYFGQALTAVTLSPASGLLYADEGGTVVAETPDGAVAWSAPTNDGIPEYSEFVDGRGTFYTWATNYPGGSTVAFRTDGTPAWNVDAGYPVAMGADGTVFTVSLGATPSVLEALAP